MKRAIDVERLQSIKELLLAIADGDLNYQIERTNEEDDLETLVVSLNWLTQDLKDSFQFISSLNTRGSIYDYIHIRFILNKDLNLIGINKGALLQLGISKKNVIGKSFSSLLDKDSQNEWEKIAETILEQSDFEGYHKFQFASDTRLKKMFQFGINSIPPTASGHQIILIDCIQPISKNKLIKSKIKLKRIKELSEGNLPKSKPKIILSHRDIKMVQEVRDFILQNLDKPLLSIQELAKKHGTNDFKLKQIFSQVYNNSIFRFYTEHRVKKAAALLKNTRISIEEAAKSSGFSNTTHFSTAFKKHFSISPSTYRKLYNRNF